MDLADFRQEVRVADLVQLCPLLIGGQIRQVVHFGGINARNIPANGIAKGTLRQELWPWGGAKARNQPVLPKCLTIEEYGRSELLVELLVVSLVEAFGVDTQLRQQTERLFAVATRTFNGLGTTVAEQHSVS